MPDFHCHIEQAKHNRTLASVLNSENKGKFSDWVVTGSFYSVLHMVEAMIYGCDHLLAPSSSFPRFGTHTLVKVSNVRHSIDLEPNYARKGHELRSCIINDNLWFFKDVGKACQALRGMSQSARYDCQQMNEEDADFAMRKLFNAIKEFNSWALSKGFATI